MIIRFKQNYATELYDDYCDYDCRIAWQIGDEEECKITEEYINGVRLDFPDGTFAENVPNDVFEIVEQ